MRGASQTLDAVWKPRESEQDLIETFGAALPPSGGGATVPGDVTGLAWNTTQLITASLLVRKRLDEHMFQTRFLRVLKPLFSFFSVTCSLVSGQIKRIKRLLQLRCEPVAFSFSLDIDASLVFQTLTGLGVGSR